MNFHYIIFLIIIFGIFAVIPSLIIFYIFKKLEKTLLGKILSFSYLLFVVYIFISNIFAEELFSKNDAREILAQQNIFLKDDFTIKNVNIGTGFHSDDNFNQFKIIISDKDKENLINEIKSSENFTICLNSEKCPEADKSDRYFGKNSTINYETSDFYIREHFKTFGKGKAPLNVFIRISKKDNTIFYSQ